MQTISLTFYVVLLGLLLATASVQFQYRNRVQHRYNNRIQHKYHHTYHNQHTNHLHRPQQDSNPSLDQMVNDIIAHHFTNNTNNTNNSNNSNNSSSSSNSNSNTNSNTNTNPNSNTNTNPNSNTNTNPNSNSNDGQKQGDGRMNLRMMKKIYHIHHMKLSCHVCFQRPIILDGDCRHQKRCSYCANDEEKQKKLAILQKKAQKCHTEAEKEKLQKLIEDVKEKKLYKASYCVQPLSENNLMYLHGLNTYCENNCGPEMKSLRFKQTKARSDDECQLIPCGKAIFGQEESTQDEDEDDE